MCVGVGALPESLGGGLSPAVAVSWGWTEPPDAGVISLQGEASLGRVRRAREVGLRWRHVGCTEIPELLGQGPGLGQSPRPGHWVKDPVRGSAWTPPWQWALGLPLGILLTSGARSSIRCLLNPPHGTCLTAGDHLWSAHSWTTGTTSRGPRPGFVPPGPCADPVTGPPAGNVPTGRAVQPEPPALVSQAPPLPASISSNGAQGCLPGAVLAGNLGGNKAWVQGGAGDR